MDSEDYADVANRWMADLTPFSIKIKIVREEDKFYAHFDGNNVYASQDTWEACWNGYAHFVQVFLRSKKLPEKTLTLQSPTYIIVEIGNVFDMLRESKI